jgi:hypothetical protein
MVFDYRGGPRITRKNTRIHNLVRKEASRGVVRGGGLQGSSYGGDFRGTTAGGGMYVGSNVSFREPAKKQYTEYNRNEDFSTEAITKNDFNSKYSTMTPKILQSVSNHVL